MAFNFAFLYGKFIYRPGCIFLALLCLLPLRLSCQRHAGFDKILSQHKELSHAVVNTILQGPKGFIWLGTGNGLYRFDGHNYRVYKHDPDNPGSLANNYVDMIFVDSRGIFWIATEKGFDSFDLTDETFSHYQSNENNPGGLSDNEVLHITEDKDGDLWIGTYYGGLNRFDYKTKQFRTYKHQDDNPASLSHNAVNKVFEDSKGILWVGTERGLNRFNKKEETFIHYFSNPGSPGSLKENNITAIYEDRKGILWIGTWNGGLHRYNRETDSFNNYKIGAHLSPEEQSNHNRISCILEDRAGHLWVGTYADGLGRFSREKESFEFFKYDAYLPRSIKAKMIKTLYEDNAGILWIGTHSDGIYTYDPKKEQFSHYFYHPYHPNSLSNNSVLTICEDNRESCKAFWIGTYAGLNRFDRDTQTFTNFKKNSVVPPAISKKAVRYIFIDSMNILWICTDFGLYQLDRKTFESTSFAHDSENPQSICDDRATLVYEDFRHRLWVGTGNGLNLFARDTKTFTNFKNKSGDFKILSQSYILCIREQTLEKRHILWIGTYSKGLFLLDYDRQMIHRYKEGLSDEIDFNTVRDIHEDQKNGGNVLWIAADKGLYRFEPFNNRLKRYTEDDGLPNNKVYCILEDDAGNLWISTQNGLCRFNKETEKITAFEEDYGLSIRSFDQNTCCLSDCGEMYFGGMNGFISFFPQKIQDNLQVPKIVITDFRIFDRPVKLGKKLTKSITEAREIHLSYRDSVFSIGFAALDFTWPSKNKYKYKLERLPGADGNWQETDDASNYANYMNLNPGDYRFSVIGSNNAGIWNETGAALKIFITPPYWQTWWFRLAMGGVFFMLLSLVYLMRTRRLRKELHKQQQMQETLKQSRDIMEKARDLAEYRRAEIEKLITAISSILIAVNSKGEISQWNEAAGKFFKIPATQTISQSFLSILKKYISIDLLNSLMDKGLGKDNHYPHLEIPIQFKGGDSKLLLGIINPIIDREGNKLGFLLLAEDITHRKEKEMRKNLSQKLESLGKMIGNIAHEIKSPLQYIGNNSYFIYDSFENLENFFTRLKELLDAEEVSDISQLKAELQKEFDADDIEYILNEVPRASDQIVKGVTRVSTIIQSMLVYSHPGRNIMEQSDIHKLLETTLTLIRSKKKELLDIETDFSRDVPQLLCYPGELLQVFMNILINAADAIQEKGVPGLIKISTAVDENEVIITIADNGCGIPEEIKENVYNPFFTTKEAGKGTGQGLALVHNIISQRHQGKIYFESREGAGTKFFIHLPLPQEEN